MTTGNRILAILLTGVLTGGAALAQDRISPQRAESVRPTVVTQQPQVTTQQTQATSANPKIATGTESAQRAAEPPVGPNRPERDPLGETYVALAIIAILLLIGGLAWFVSSPDDPMHTRTPDAA
jgi:hypothetical protein